MFGLKSQNDGLHPTFGTFDGFTLIRLLLFPATIEDALNVLLKSEAIRVRILV